MNISFATVYHHWPLQVKDRRTRQKDVLVTCLLIRHHKLEIFKKIRNKNFKEYVVSITQEKIIVEKVHTYIFICLFILILGN